MKKLLLFGLVAILTITLYSFKYLNTNEDSNYYKITTETADPNWDDYRSWYRITNEEPNTGDPVGLLDGKHKGVDGYREIYINKPGEKEWKKGGNPDYPEGTIIVKESYSNKSKWEKDKGGVLTVMIKLAEGESPSSGDWGWAMGKSSGNGPIGWIMGYGKVKSGPKGRSKFCTKCHVMGQVNDYTFITKDFLNSTK